MSSLDLRIPPLVVVAAGALLMWLVARYIPEANLAVHGQSVTASGIAALGLFFCIAGVLEFRRARTTTNPMNPVGASSLVARGIYRYSRNPMYLGFACLLTGWAVYLGNPLALLLIVALETLFGPEFEAYRSEVRRWI